MIRSILRYLLSPIARWASLGSQAKVYVMRDEDGAFLMFVDGFGIATPCKLEPYTAHVLSRCMIAATRDHTDHLPVIPARNCPVEVQYYNASTK